MTTIPNSGGLRGLSLRKTLKDSQKLSVRV